MAQVENAITSVDIRGSSPSLPWAASPKTENTPKKALLRRPKSASVKAANTNTVRDETARAEEAVWRTVSVEREAQAWDAMSQGASTQKQKKDSEAKMWNKMSQGASNIQSADAMSRSELLEDKRDHKAHEHDSGEQTREQKPPLSLSRSKSLQSTTSLNKQQSIISDLFIEAFSDEGDGGRGRERWRKRIIPAKKNVVLRGPRAVDILSGGEGLMPSGAKKSLRRGASRPMSAHSRTSTGSLKSQWLSSTSTCRVESESRQGQVQDGRAERDSIGLAVMHPRNDADTHQEQAESVVTQDLKQIWLPGKGYTTEVPKRERTVDEILVEKARLAAMDAEPEPWEIDFDVRMIDMQAEHATNQVGRCRCRQWWIDPRCECLWAMQGVVTLREKRQGKTPKSKKDTKKGVAKQMGDKHHMSKAEKNENRERNHAAATAKIDAEVSKAVEQHSLDMSLVIAAAKGDITETARLRLAGATGKGRDERGNTCIMKAVNESGHSQHAVELLRVLISIGADVNATNNRNNTALHYAYEKGYVNLTRHLLQHGAAESLKTLNMKDQYPRDCMSARPSSDKPEKPWMLPFPKAFKVNAMLSCRYDPPAYYADMKPPIRLGGTDIEVPRTSDGMRMKPERLLKKLDDYIAPMSPRSRRPMGHGAQAKFIEDSVIGKNNLYKCHPSRDSTVLFNTRAQTDDPFAGTIQRIARANGVPFDMVRRMYNKMDQFGEDGTFTITRFKRALKHYGINDFALTDRMFEIYQENNEVTFDRLVSSLCDFRTAPPEKQCRMLFRLMDTDDGNSLGRMEIFEFLANRLKHIETQIQAYSCTRLATSFFPVF